jgi:hypothetical protein
LRSSREETVEEHRNHEREAEPMKIGAGIAAEVVPSPISTLSNITNTATMMKRD